MKKNLLVLTALACSSLHAQSASSMTRPSDSIETLELIMVKASRGLSQAFAKTEMQRTELLNSSSGRDLPVLLQWQPSLIVTSDAGNGVGYTGIRVRGSDATRTLVSVNGVPINDAESQGVFWVNMPDLSQSTSSIEIQRGVGSSSGGTGAFGAGVNIQTESPNQAQSLLHLSYGSFGTRKFSLSHSSGWLKDRWSFDLRLSNISSNGFVDRASSELQSYWASAAYRAGKNKNIPIKLLHFGGREKTYQAWWGVPIEKYSGTAADLQAHYERNLGYTYRNREDSLNLFQSQPSQYNYYLYPNETDNYLQVHTHLYTRLPLGEKQFLNTTLFHTKGAGYFEQFKPEGNLADYGVNPGIDSSLWQASITRQRWLSNHLLGLNANWENQGTIGQWQAGLFASQYWGQHFGDITHISTADLAQALRYYQSTGNKFEASTWVKYRSPRSAFGYMNAELQERWVQQQGLGTDNDLRPVDFNHNYAFFNPKIGWDWQGFHHQLFASWSRAHREPARSDYTDAPNGSLAKPERLDDFELGWNYLRPNWNLKINAFFMDYKDQLVLTGRVNDVGTALRTNVDASFRRGLEMQSQAVITPRSLVVLTALGNASLSDNRIAQMDIVWLDYATYEEHVERVENTPISYSPGFTAMGGLQAEWGRRLYLPKTGEWTEKTHGIRWSSQLRNRWVGRQYLDNSGTLSRSLDPYRYAEWTIQAEGAGKNLRGQVWKPSLQLQVINLFNTRYASNGYSWGYTYGSPEVIQEVFVFPQAGRHFLLSMQLAF